MMVEELVYRGESRYLWNHVTICDTMADGDMIYEGWLMFNRILWLFKTKRKENIFVSYFTTFMELSASERRHFFYECDGYWKGAHKGW